MIDNSGPSYNRKLADAEQLSLLADFVADCTDFELDYTTYAKVKRVKEGEMQYGVVGRPLRDLDKDLLGVNRLPQNNFYNTIFFVVDFDNRTGIHDESVLYEMLCQLQRYYADNLAIVNSSFILEQYAKSVKHKAAYATGYEVPPERVLLHCKQHNIWKQDPEKYRKNNEDEKY